MSYHDGECVLIGKRVAGRASGKSCWRKKSKERGRMISQGERNYEKALVEWNAAAQARAREARERLGAGRKESEAERAKEDEL